MNKNIHLTANNFFLFCLTNLPLILILFFAISDLPLYFLSIGTYFLCLYIFNLYFKIFLALKQLESLPIYIEVK